MFEINVILLTYYILAFVCCSAHVIVDYCGIKKLMSLLKI